MKHSDEKFSTFKKAGRAIVFGPISIIKRTWKWALTIILILAVVHSVATLILGKQVENEIAKIKAKGDPVSCAELAGKPIPDAENGAVIYEKAFKLLDNLPKESYYDILFSNYRNDPKAWERARNVLKKSDKIFLLVEEAAAKPQCRFKTNWEDGFNALFPYYKKIRDLSRLIAVRAMVNAKDGNTSEALKSLQMGYKISDSIKDDPIIVSVLVRVAILGIADKSLEFVAESTIIGFSEAENTISIISQINLNPELVMAMKGERAIGLYAFDNAKNIPLLEPGEDIPSVSWFELSHLGRPIFYLDKANFIRLMNKLIYKDILIPSRYLPKYAPDEHNWSDRYEISNILFPMFSKARLVVDSGQARLNGDQLLLALCAYKHQFGSYPETLAELKSKISFKVPSEDPFSGKDFIYKLKNNGFLLYSIGEDLKDDGGERIKDIYVHPAKGDIVWQMDH